ncbi:MAG: hypothetical protein Q4D65_10505 [Peptostreptococcaceae bacterium]|nr:hypothetical protein [Peptostreptococcaceae bacterium]
MKRKTTLLVAGILVAGLAFAGAYLRGSDSQQSGENMSGVKNASTFSNQLETQPPSIQEYLDELDFLSEKEKQQLLDDEKAAKPFYDKIAKLTEENKKIGEEIFKKHDSLVKEYDALIHQNAELWEKLVKNATNEQLALPTNEEYIRSSEALSEAEKELLIKQDRAITELQKKMDAVYEEIDKATESQNREIDKYYQEIDAIHNKSKAVWDKIYSQKIGENDKAEAIPYQDKK